MRNPRISKIVHGFGINDADYKTCIEVSIDGIRKRLWTCPFYEVWKTMLRRCYSVKYQKDFPSYSGCSVSTGWLSFSVFREWMAGQEWEGNQLDKDILIPGNKIYCPEACVFVPRQLNLFTTDSNATRGEFPIGVSWNKQASKFKASCCNPFTGKEEYLGLFLGQEEAHEAWRKRKHEHACTYADQQTNPRIANALRTRYAFGEFK